MSSRRATPRLSYHRASELSAETLDAMWALREDAVVVERAEFEQGLLAMDEVWLCHVGAELRGFGGVKLLEPAWRGRKSGVIFTGRVYLAPSVRGASLLQRVGAHYYWQCLKSTPFRRLYWLFDASSYKSYLLLPRNFRTYWPRPGATPPAREQAIFSALGDHLANWTFDPETGIVRHPWLIIIDGQIAREPEVLEDPDVAFYDRLNPHQAQGDGLMCLCPLSPGNWASCLVRAVRRAMRRRARPVGPTVASRVVAQAPDTQRSPLQ